MDVREFAQLHLPALEADEVRFNLQISVITAATPDALSSDLEHWTLGAPGHCATRSSGRSILLGALDRSECEALARTTRDLAYPGVVGSDERAVWFAGAARDEGIAFDTAIPQRINVLRHPPRFPNSEGRARSVTAEDAPLLMEWAAAFHRETVPYDPPPTPQGVAKAAASGRYMFWIVRDQPVSMAAVARRLKNTIAIAPVYTPPHLRGRGYAGSVTSAVVERAFAEGKTAVCLYTDMRNPFSNRCYARIGFVPYCDAWHYLRA
jgi:RimJ/RimL family protein N-acetyltransferase